jgi:hypothetical protein
MTSSLSSGARMQLLMPTHWCFASHSIAALSHTVPQLCICTCMPSICTLNISLHVPQLALTPLCHLHALCSALPQVREAAASGIGQLVDVTSPRFLQPFLIKITGPLIRIVGDRFPSAVKAAILHTLGKWSAKNTLYTCSIYSTSYAFASSEISIMFITTGCSVSCLL